MPTSFRPYNPDQSYLLPPCPRDWLPETHLALFVSDSLDELDLSAFYARYAGDGRRNQPFDPRMMVKILVYGYATGVVSSRQIARKIEEDVAFRYLAAGNFPAHRTICDFRLAHLEEFRDLFVQVVRLAREAGLVKLGRVAVDGTRMGANASRHKAMSYGRMREEEKRLRREIDELLERAQVQDAAEDEQYGADVRGDELPEELRRREDRLRKIREAKARLEAQQAEQDRAKGRHPDDDRKGPRGQRYGRDFGVPPDKSQSNFTDPESRIMLAHDGWKQAYNPQLAVDGDSHLIVSTGLTQSAADVQELLPVLDTLEQINGQRAQQVLADAGYRSEDNFRRLEELGIDAVISLGREGKKPPDPTSRLEATRRMAEKLKSPEGRQAYRTRKGTVEPVIGWIKQILGFRRFSLRGVRKVRAEWDLVCLAVDLRRMHRLARA
jgi:transposase